MSVKFAFVILLLVMVRGFHIQKLHVEETVFEEILKANEVEDLDLEDVLRVVAKQCQCQGNKCLCCDSATVFGKTTDVCLEVTHASGVFTLKLQVLGNPFWQDEITESSVKELAGQSQTVKIDGTFGSVKVSGELTFHDIKITPENLGSSCVDGKADLQSKGRSQRLTVNLGCFTV